jgi:S-layer protein
MVGSAAGNLTLGAHASTAGITSVTLTDVDASDTVTIGAGFASNLNVVIATSATALNTVSAAAYTKVLTVTAPVTSLDNTTSVITGGTGTADVLSMTLETGTLVTTSISAIEKWTFTGVGATASTVTMVSADGNIASGASLTVDMTSGDDDVLAANFANESNGTVTILVDGTAASDHIVTLGQGADTYTSTSVGTDTVVATKGNNTISTGDGVDIITLGTGTDTITAHASGETADKDLIKLTAEAQFVADTLVMTDWNTTMEVLLTFAIVDASSRNLVALDDGADAVAANSVKSDITGATDLGTVTANSTQLSIDSTTAYSTASAIETALEYGGAFQLTNAGAKAAGDTFFVSYDDNVSTYVAVVTVNSVVADNAYFGVGSLDAVQLIKLTGVADNTDVVTGDLVYVAT